MNGKKRICAAILTFFFLCACVPTPDHEVVVNKADGVAEERIFATPMTSAAPFEEQPKTLQSEGVPKHWEAEASTEYVTVEIDAEVICPEGPYPVDRIEEYAFTLADVNKAISGMYPNVVGYLPIDDGGDHASKEIWERILENTLRGFAHREPDGSITYHPLEYHENALAHAKNGLAQSVSQEGRFLPGDRLPDDFKSKNGALLLLDDGREIRVHIGRQEIAVFEEQAAMYTELDPATEPCFMDDPIQFHPSISPQEARKMAEAYIAHLGLSEELTFAHMEKAGIASIIEQAYVSEGYQVEFTRTGSYPARSFYLMDTCFLMNFQDTEVYNVPLGYPETLFLYVSEKGIESMEWKKPFRLAGRANDDVALLPFSELSDLAIRYFKLGHAHLEQPFYSGFLVTSATLTVLPQRLKDEQGLVLMPVWVLQMDPYLLKQDRSLDRSKMDKALLRPYVLVINAVDGSRISLPYDTTKAN